MEPVVKQILKTQSDYLKVWIGVQNLALFPIDPPNLGLPENTGFLVLDVIENGTAEGILENNDVITHIDGKPLGYLPEQNSTCPILWPKKVGDVIKLNIIRQAVPVVIF